MTPDALIACAIAAAAAAPPAMMSSFGSIPPAEYNSRLATWVSGSCFFVTAVAGITRKDRTRDSRYSAFMQFTGSTANTLLAGKYDAANAAANNVTGTAAKVTGSIGATP